MQWKKFRAGAAEDITGMDSVAQRQRRQRGQLTPITGGKASLNAVHLGEMMLVHHVSPYGLVNYMKNLTVRGIAASWVAYWAAIESGLSEHDARRLTGRRQQPAASHMLAHHDDTNWRDTKFTDDPAGALARDKEPVAVVVDLRALGKRLADRAGSLIEHDDDTDDPGYLVEED